MIHKLASIATCVSCFLTGAVAQAHVVVPAANNTADAIGQNRIAGTGGDLRQQILIGEAHLLNSITRHKVGPNGKVTVSVPNTPGEFLFVTVEHGGTFTQLLIPITSTCP